MTLFRGGREIQLLYLGRGHTDTDVVVYLPKERIVCTGDLMESVVSYMGDSYPEEWIATLDRLKALDFDTVMPGHGVVFKGKGKIEAFQRYLRDVAEAGRELKKAGVRLTPRRRVSTCAPSPPTSRRSAPRASILRRFAASTRSPIAPNRHSRNVRAGLKPCATRCLRSRSPGRPEGLHYNGVKNVAAVAQPFRAA